MLKRIQMVVRTNLINSGIKMAKKKVTAKETKTSPAITATDKLANEINKEYGIGICVDANEILDKEQIIIPVSPRIDAGIHGGIPEGSWVIMSGPPKCGKSTTCLEFAATCQQSEYGDREIYYFDVEGRLKKMNLEQIPNLNLKKFHIIKSTKEKILAAEDHLTIAVNVLKNVPRAIVIIDSTSAMAGVSTLEDRVRGDGREPAPRILSNFCKQMGGVVPIQDSIVILVQHLITNTSGKGAMYMEDGGRKIQYQVDVKLRCTYFERWEDTSKTQIVQKAHWNVLSSALGPPGAKIESYLRYGEGIDMIYETMKIAEEIGIIAKAGSWYTYEEYKVQGAEKLRQYFVDNPDKYKELTKEVQEMLS